MQAKFGNKKNIKLVLSSGYCYIDLRLCDIFLSYKPLA